jgi:hypothetical protein
MVANVPNRSPVLPWHASTCRTYNTSKKNAGLIDFRNASISYSGTDLNCRRTAKIVPAPGGDFHSDARNRFSTKKSEPCGDGETDDKFTIDIFLFLLQLLIFSAKTRTCARNDPIQLPGY